MLPSPQVSDQELEDLAKLGQTGAEALAGADEAGPTRALLQDYNETPSMRQPMRTPRAPEAQDSLLLEAQNILALNQTTPVLAVGFSATFHPAHMSSLTTLFLLFSGWRQHAFARGWWLL